eukprot:tig00001057_g6699.t1
MHLANMLAFPAHLVPIAGLVVTVLTLVTCYIMSLKLGHLLNPYPFISLTGYLAPERYVYCGGLTFVGGCVAASVIGVWAVVGAALERAAGPKGAGTGTRLLNAATCCTGVAAAGFLSLQAIVPLQEEARLIMTGELPPSAFSLQSAVHAGSALLFFALTAVHAPLSCVLLYRAAGRVWTTGLKLKLVAAALVGLLLALACGLAPGAFGSIAASQVGGPALQYLLVLSIAAYYGSYYADLRAANASLALLGPLPFPAAAPASV